MKKAFLHFLPNLMWFFKVECNKGTTNLWKIIKYLAEKRRKALFDLPSTSTHFSADSGYPKIRLRVPVPPPLFRYSNAYADWMSLAMIALCLCYKVTKPRKETIFSSTRNRIFILVFIRMYGFILLIPTNLRVKKTMKLFMFLVI